MIKNKNTTEELKVIRAFMEKKKITFSSLSRTMDYSIPHVITIFNGEKPPTKKFMRCVLEALQKILQKDLKDFYKLARSREWTTSNWK